jgi:hypothetical protein
MGDDDDDFPSSEYFHGRPNDIGEDGNHVYNDFYIPLMNEIINEADVPMNEDHVRNHSSTKKAHLFSYHGLKNPNKVALKRKSLTPLGT